MSIESLEKKITTLRQTLSWADLVMANVSECILVLDSDWRVVFANSYLAEIIGQNRILLLGKYVWEILPFTEAAIRPKKRQLSLKKVAQLDGVYDFRVQNLNLKMLFNGKYVDQLQQAVCIITDATIELKAGSALMSMQEELAALKARLKD